MRYFHLIQLLSFPKTSSDGNWQTHWLNDWLTHLHSLPRNLWWGLLHCAIHLCSYLHKYIYPFIFLSFWLPVCLYMNHWSLIPVRTSPPHFPPTYFISSGNFSLFTLNFPSSNNMYIIYYNFSFSLENNNKNNKVQLGKTIQKSLKLWNIWKKNQFYFIFLFCIVYVYIINNFLLSPVGGAVYDIILQALYSQIKNNNKWKFALHWNVNITVLDAVGKIWKYFWEIKQKKGLKGNGSFSIYEQYIIFFLLKMKIYLFVK